MTIGYILDDSLDRSDGVQQAVLAIGEQMSQLGHEVHYIVAETRRTDIPNVHVMSRYLQASFNGNSVRTPRPVSRRKVRELFEQVSFDVLHVQMPYSPFMAGRVIAGAPKHIRIFGTFHILPYNLLASTGTRVLGVMQRRQMQHFVSCFAVSAPALNFMERAFRVQGEVLPNPVRWTFFHGRKPTTSKKAKIVFVGRFEERKGVLELLRSYADLPQSLKDTTQLILCGAGPLHETAQRLSERLNVAAELPGFVTEDEKADHLASATIAVFPSISGESFGIVLAEAMSAGAGITLGGNNPGYASVLGDWPDVLFDPKDQQAFCATLQRFLTDVALRTKIGAQQHETARNYDIRTVASRLEAAYKAVDQTK